MKLVEFTRDMRPHTKGDTRAVPDTVADELVAAGDAVVRPSVFDDRQPEPPLPSRRGRRR